MSSLTHLPVKAHLALKARGLASPPKGLFEVSKGFRA